jgi:hypothetical protein
MVTEQSLDVIKTGVSRGMQLSDAYILAGLSAEEIEEVENSSVIQQELMAAERTLELDLLKDMRSVAQIQRAAGKHEATAWLLEHLYSRYTKRGEDMSLKGMIHIHTGSSTGAKVEVNE